MMKLMFAVVCMTAVLVSGCSGEPTYAKPTATGVKDKAVFSTNEPGKSAAAPLAKD